MNAFNQAAKLSNAKADLRVGTDAAQGTALWVDGLHAGYLGTPVLEGVSFQLPMGAMTGVVGPNGAGKSTLLKGVLGLLDDAHGQVLVLGGALTERRNRVAYVPQRNAVDWDFPTTVLDVVKMGRYGRLAWWRWP
jgi:manganese/zinc/iron transport system ATP- binding protein